MGEVAAVAQVLSHVGILKAIQERVRFARARFGLYDVIDFVVVLIGYALSGEPTLKAFYERLEPLASPFMALFGRNRLPDRSTLSRFLAALDQASVEALRTLFQEDLVARKAFTSPGGLWDRLGQHWVVVDVDGTRQAARQRALPQLESLPSPSSYASMDGHLWGCRERRVSRRTQTRSPGDHAVRDQPFPSPFPHPGPS